MSFRCSALGSRSRGDTALSIVAPAWGIFLADTVRRIANAFQEQYGQSPLSWSPSTTRLATQPQSFVANSVIVTGSRPNNSLETGPSDRWKRRNRASQRPLALLPPHHLGKLPLAVQLQFQTPCLRHFFATSHSIQQTPPFSRAGNNLSFRTLGSLRDACSRRYGIFNPVGLPGLGSRTTMSSTLTPTI